MLWQPEQVQGRVLEEGSCSITKQRRQKGTIKLDYHAYTQGGSSSSNSSSGRGKHHANQNAWVGMHAALDSQPYVSRTALKRTLGPLLGCNSQQLRCAHLQAEHTSLT